MERFPKASLISFELTKPTKLQGWLKRFLLPSKWRMANAVKFYWLWFSITIRRPWLPEVAFSEGWDACFRQLNGIKETQR